MDFSSLTAAMDATIAATFQRTDDAGNPVTLTCHFADHRTDLTVPVVVKNPAMEEDYVPGKEEGTNVVILFVPSSVLILIPRGSTATYGPADGLHDYDIFQSQVDREGGQTLRLRRRGVRWDQ